MLTGPIPADQQPRLAPYTVQLDENLRTVAAEMSQRIVENTTSGTRNDRHAVILGKGEINLICHLLDLVHLAKPA